MGILVDNYKIKKFEEELKELNITEIAKAAFTLDTTILVINIDDNKVNDITKLCTKLQIGFKQSN